MSYSNHYSFYSSIDKPLDVISSFYFHSLLEINEMRGRRICKPPENYDGGLYIHIPSLFRMFCFKDWFNTRVDLICASRMISDHFYEEMNILIKTFLTEKQSADIDYDVIFFDMFKEQYNKRIDLERLDYWRR